MIVAFHSMKDCCKDLCTTHWLCSKQGRFCSFEAMFQRNSSSHKGQRGMDSIRAACIASVEDIKSQTAVSDSPGHSPGTLDSKKSLFYSPRVAMDILSLKRNDWAVPFCIRRNGIHWNKSICRLSCGKEQSLSGHTMKSKNVKTFHFMLYPTIPQGTQCIPATLLLTRADAWEIRAASWGCGRQPHALHWTEQGQALIAFPFCKVSPCHAHPTGHVTTRPMLPDH